MKLLTIVTRAALKMISDEEAVNIKICENGCDAESDQVSPTSPQGKPKALFKNELRLLLFLAAP